MTIEEKYKYAVQELKRISALGPFLPDGGLEEKTVSYDKLDKALDIVDEALAALGEI